VLLKTGRSPGLQRPGRGGVLPWPPRMKSAGSDAQPGRRSWATSPTIGVAVPAADNRDQLSRSASRALQGGGLGDGNPRARARSKQGLVASSVSSEKYVTGSPMDPGQDSSGARRLPSGPETAAKAAGTRTATLAGARFPATRGGRRLDVQAGPKRPDRSEWPGGWASVSSFCVAGSVWPAAPRIPGLQWAENGNTAGSQGRPGRGGRHQTGRADADWAGSRRPCDTGFQGTRAGRLTLALRKACRTGASRLLPLGQHRPEAARGVRGARVGNGFFSDGTSSG